LSPHKIALVHAGRITQGYASFFAPRILIS
jgi:hypothetical protein